MINISEWEDITSASKANIFLNIINCEFIISMYSLSSILSVTYHASKIPQLKDQDISSAFEIIKDIISVLKEKRSNARDVFKNIYKKSECVKNTLFFFFALWALKAFRSFY